MNRLTIYTGHADGGCIDIGTIKLKGYSVVPDAEIFAMQRKHEGLKNKLHSLNQFILENKGDPALAAMTISRINLILGQA